jgi:hypothetical protein
LEIKISSARFSSLRTIQTEVILKKKILSIVAALAFVIPMSIIGFAGLNGSVSADVPFDFNVGGKEFKAGKYSVSRLSPNNTAGALIIRSRDNREVANFNVNPVFGKGESPASFVFRRYGNQYFLARVFDADGRQGYELMKSKAEREAAKKRDIITRNAVEPEVVTVVAKLGQ